MFDDLSSRTMELTVSSIHIGPEAAQGLDSVDRVQAVAGKGLVGDRCFFADGAGPGMALTLVESRVVEEVGLPPGGTRRQLTVDGTGLNDLVGRRFQVGEVECFGVELCEPCLHLEQMTRPGIIKELVHRAGINADILIDGTISVGDRIVPL
jgi:MOSC domain-containing protein YiiM